MSDTYYKDHWTHIEPERFERYKQMFQWSEASEPLLAPAQVGEGHVVVDVGCGPGFMALELANRVGPKGHVHAVEVNGEFAAHARQLAKEHGLTDRVTVHLVDDASLPLPSDAVDRIIAKNVMVYVDDPAQTYREFHRVLRPGGKAHAVDSDWSLAFAEPVPGKLWHELMGAASHAFRTPEVGRRLYGYAKAAGFAEVAVEVVCRPDTTGRLLPMLRNLCGYARGSGRMDTKSIDQVLEICEAASAAGTLLVLNPQFLVTAKV